MEHGWKSVISAGVLVLLATGTAWAGTPPDLGRTITSVYAPLPAYERRDEQFQQVQTISTGDALVGKTVLESKQGYVRVDTGSGQTLWLDKADLVLSAVKQIGTQLCGRMSQITDAADRRNAAVPGIGKGCRP